MSVLKLSLKLPAGAVPYYLGEAGAEWAAEQIVAEFGDEHPRIFVIADSTVELLYLKPFKTALEKLSLDVRASTFTAGERYKTLGTASRLLDELAHDRFARDDLIVGLGGGVTTDIAGFVASIYQRGVRWVSVPTTLLGMADASVGGKTGVDHSLGKNLIGSFHHPQSVIAPLRLLETLPTREWRSGSAEIVKIALLRDARLWSKVSELDPDLSLWPRPDVQSAIRDAVQHKHSIVESDERDEAGRRLLNLGHTFGHGIETATGYGVFLHGEAVFLGMRAAIRMSVEEGLLSRSIGEEIESVLGRIEYPSAEIRPDVLLDSLGRDKKVRASKLHWVLLERIGKGKIVSDLRHEVVHETAEWLCGLMKQGKPVLDGRRGVRVLVLNGPNLNLLGEREPNIYGNATYDQLAREIAEFAEAREISALVRQSNSEGELVSLIQSARTWADGIVLNPGGYTHTSVAIRDAILAVTLPVVEVHLTDITAREDFRKVSLIAPVCRATLAGRGTAGYIEALQILQDEVMNRGHKGDRGSGESRANLSSE